MIKIIRKQTSPLCLEDEKLKNNGKYNCGDVIEKLEKDFYGKCYLCESNQFSINVEHFTPHKKNKDLKFDWNNLFFACSHCNNIKLAKYDNILNCTDNINIEEYLYYNSDSVLFPKYEINITINQEFNSCAKTKQSAELLNKIYNGHTDLKIKDAEKLKDNLLEHLTKFQSKLLKYTKSKFNPNKQKRYKKKIIDELHNSSHFCAFKRYIIKNNNELNKEFKKYMTD